MVERVDIIVTSINDVPIPTFTTLTVQENTAKRGTLTATDGDINDTLTFSVVRQPQHGTLNLETYGRFRYAPNHNFNGNDSFSYKVSDGIVDSAEQNVTITVTSVNYAPVATFTTLTLQEDTNKTATLIATDDDNDTLTFSIVTQPQHGTINLEANGSFAYSPNPNFNGRDSFTYKVNNGKDDSVEQNVIITVTSVNDAPTPTFTTLTVQEDTTKRATLTASDIDGDDRLTFQIVTQPQNGTLNLEANGSFIYTPNHNFNGSDSFTYKVNDGTVDSAAQRVTITVANINDAPRIYTNFENVTMSNKATKKLYINIRDLDGDSLTLNIESNSSILTISKNFTNPILQAVYTSKALDFNITGNFNTTTSARVTITLSDGDTNVSKSFDVNIRKTLNSKVIRWRGLVYKTVTSPYSGRVWLDRNLGAKRVCQDIEDTDCFGDYYQWGREADGHEKNDSLTTIDTAKSLNDPNVKGKFIITDRDWADFDTNGSIRSANWAKTDGSSICPVGFKVPNDNEFSAEMEMDRSNSDKNNTRIASITDAFNSFLKLPISYYRSSDGNVNYNTKIIELWTSSFHIPFPGLPISPHNFNIYTIPLIGNGFYAPVGFPVRCIKAN